MQAWLHVLAETASAVVTVIFVDGAAERLQQATEVFAASSDAAGDGRGTPGIGGYMHGFYWRVALTPALLALMHITAWETVAACVGLLFSQIEARQS